MTGPPRLRRAGPPAPPHPPAVRRARAPLGLLGAGLAVVGTGLIVTARSLPAGGAETVGTDAAINAGAGSPADIAAHNSPALARNPRRPANLVVASRVDSPRFSCAVHVSYDAGATWAEAELPFPAGEEAPPRCYVPDAAFGPDGTLHVSFSTLIGQGNRPNAVWVTSSTDGGRTYSEPARAVGPLAFQPRLAADRDVAGRLYLSWVQAADVVNLGFAGPGNPILVARSDDGGRTWGAPARITGPSRRRAVAPSPAAASGRRLYVAYLDLGEDRLDYNGAHGGRGGEPHPGPWALVLARSDDAGETWEETVVDAGLVPAARFVAFLPPFPAVAHDGSGRRVFVAFSDARLGDPDVWLWASADEGATFSPPRRVNDTPRGDGTSQYLPAVAVAPDERIDVAYYDRRADGDDVRNHVSLQSSFDRGRSFGSSVRLSSVAFDSRIGFGADRDLADLGSRLALVSTGHRVLAVWADTRAGTAVSLKQDLARAVVSVSRPAPLRGPLRAAGIAVVASAFVVV
ncbi:MAG: sialidase family protein, partial [Acidimicrobiia bacterium]